MRITTSMRLFALLVTMALLLSGLFLFGQETTAGLQGTVKDASGAVVSNAHIVVRGTTLAGDKALDSDATGYYRFANLPPGVYSLEVTAKGFKTFKRDGLTLEVGHLPTVEISLEVGAAAEIVEVSGRAPVIDVTTNTSQTNVTEDVIANAPHGYSFQSVIQYAPMARNEPLAGAMGGTGGSLPGSSGNGNSVGFSIGGAADSESSYLVEGQDTENISGGYSKANVPFEFIQEVQVKTSGVEAEHGGALGGVVNVIMQKGGNAYHGAFFLSYEADPLDGSPNNTLRYNPFGGTDPVSGDVANQLYQSKKDHFKVLQTGFKVGGPIMKDRIWFFAGFDPQVNTRARTVNFAAFANANQSLGNQYFTQDEQIYYGTARIDATLTQKIRLFGSWLNQYARETGASMPGADPIASQAAAGYANTAIFSPLTLYSHGIGWSAPNATYNVGADISLTPRIVATTRFGYFFENYHDFGWPTSNPNLVWNPTTSGNDNAGNPLPASLNQPAGTSTTPYLSSFTKYNANKHYQFDEDVAFFKSGWGGTHNFKFGYQLNRLVNVISQNGNVPLAFVSAGAGQSHSPSTTNGGGNCNTLAAEWGGNCAGQYGYLTVQDFATVLPQPAGDWNHALFAQDAWTIGHGLTLNLGIRIEKESLPVPPGVIPSGLTVPQSINFSWSDKVEPRLGGAWGSKNGKIKVFGSYGVVNDVMKLLLAQTSWGAQAYEQCSYALGPDGTSAGFNVSDINLVFANGRACPNGLPTTGANFAGGTTPPSLVDPSGVSLIENVNFRPWEPVAPGVKPYRQHEFVGGVDYQLNRDWALEARYDRRRLDHVIEDASLSDRIWGETYTVVNPGEGVNATFNGYANYLTSIGQRYGVPGWAFNDTTDYGPGAAFGTCATCPANPKAVRNYDGLEFRVTKSTSKGWAGMFSYTWSSLWGNYTGLTTTDQNDGGSSGRDSPDTTRAFDEPFYYFGANGKSINGPLPTDRPNTFKGNAYYQLPWRGHSQTTTFGLFQAAYQGSPISSYLDLTAATIGIPYEATYLYGHGKYVNTTVDPSTGNITLGNPYSRRTPWFTQTDFNLGHEIKVNKNNERQILGFQVTVTNLFNQHALTSVYEGANSQAFASSLHPGYGQPNGAGQVGGISLSDGAFLYQTLEGGYNPQQWINGAAAAPAGCTGAACTSRAIAPVVQSSWYGQPYSYQLSRNMRLGVRFSF